MGIGWRSLDRPADFFGLSSKVMSSLVWFKCCIHIGFGKLWTGALVKLNPRTCTSCTRGTSGAKARFSRVALIAALKRCATQRNFFITADIRCFITVCLSFVFTFLLIGSAAFAQDGDK